MPDKDLEESDECKEGEATDKKDCTGTTDNPPSVTVTVHVEWQKPPHP
jgi:hypothetical protein